MDDSIFNRSPWSIKDERFKYIQSTFQVRNTFEFLKEKHRLLSIYIEGSDLPMKSVLLTISADTFQIDKPIDLHNPPKTFRIYFRDQNNTWNFVNAELEGEDIYHLSMVMPNELHRLESRWHNRVPTPTKARATLRFDDSSLVDLQILNLSASGMLVCSGSENDESRLNSIVQAITIDITDNSMQQLSAVVDQGIVVRSYQNNKSGCVCHGITFVHKDKYSVQNLHKILT